MLLLIYSYFSVHYNYVYITSEYICIYFIDITISSTLLCNNGSVRLIDGETDREGRVEVCLNNEWSRICQDKWDYREAAVVCSQLAYPIEGSFNSTQTTQTYTCRYTCIITYICST